MSKLDLPDYREQSPDVRARFERLKRREVVLSVQNLGKSFDSPDGETVALRSIRFDTHRREFLCVVGPSGCGKSTLIRMLAGLEDPTVGEVLLDGEAVFEPGPDRGMVFQGYTLFPWLTVKKNVMFGLRRKGEYQGQAEGQAREWLEMVGLSDWENAYPYQLSGGMKQRVAIARALANRPKVLLMDEPFSALDTQTRGRLQNHLLAIWRNVELTVVFITHDLEEAIYLADRILVLKANPGEVAELVEVPVPRPRNPEQFLSPEFLAVKQRLERLIQPEESEAPDTIRLTAVGDDVL